MYFFFHMLFTLSRKVNIVFERNKDLHLVILSNGKTVRLMGTSDLKKANANDEFDVANDVTKIQQNDVFICGKLTDPGVVTCKKQDSRIVFRFNNRGTGLNIETDGNLCLTKKGLDSKTNGYYLNLSKCNGSELQLFNVVDVLVPEPEDMKFAEKEKPLLYKKVKYYGNNRINKSYERTSPNYFFSRHRYENYAPIHDNYDFHDLMDDDERF